LSAASQRLRNILWGAFSGAAIGVVGAPALAHGEMRAWFFVSAVAAYGLSGLLRPVRRTPELYWSGLLDWCFTGSHAVYPRN
jgi:hypothetical protein